MDDRQYQGLAKRLDKIIGGLEDIIDSIEQLIGKVGSNMDAVIYVRDIPDNQAKDELVLYFRENPGKYPSDAATALRLGVDKVRDLCIELENAGFLCPDKDSPGLHERDKIGGDKCVACNGLLDRRMGE